MLPFVFKHHVSKIIGVVDVNTSMFLN